jgi:hypothetical protein
LLAFGNGAIDVIAGFIASGAETEGGVNVSIGSFLGSTILVTGFVCPMVIFYAKSDVKVMWRLIYRCPEKCS